MSGRVALRPQEKRLLRLDEAAEYCSVSPSVFERVCPVRPIDLRDGEKVHVRYDRLGIDDWRRKLGSDSAFGTIYVVGYGPYVKIGFTRKTVERRVADLQTGSPEKIQVFASFEGTLGAEQRLHKRFASLRLEGEWFRREGNLATWIEEGCPL